MMKLHTLHRILPAVLLSVVLVSGCQKDDKEKLPLRQHTSGLLTFDVTQSDGWLGSQTKAGPYRSEMLLMECDDPDAPIGEVYICMEEEDIPQHTEVMPETRAGETDAQVKYGVFAYQGSGVAPDAYVPGDDVEKFTEIDNLGLYPNGKYVGQDDGLEIYAPGADAWLHFIAYGPYMQVAQSEQTANPALLETPKWPYFKYTADQESAKTTDLLFGGCGPISGDLNTTDDGVTPPVELSLSHILSKVRVHTGSIAAGRITSISLKGLKNSGTFNLDNDGKWILADVIQDYSASLAEGAEGNVTFDDLYLMPQALSENAVIEMVVEIVTDGSEAAREITRTYTLTKKLKAFIAEWKPGKQYTYTISTPHEVEVEVTDDIEYEGTYPVKKNLQIKNTGLADAYIRVAIDGSWVVDEIIDGKETQLIVSDWKNDDDPDTVDDGEFDWPAGKPEMTQTNSNDWRLGSDGYYYYMKKTVPGETAKALFDSYKLTANSPMSGAYLELSIIAQGVFANDIADVFPDDILKVLNQQ